MSQFQVKMKNHLNNGLHKWEKYHMNKEHWITILLDGTVPKQKICDLIDISYDLTSTSKT